MRRRLALLLALAACAAPGRIACTRPGAEVAYVIDHGWHTDIAIPSDELAGPAAIFRTLFPGSRAFVFGFGKRTFFTAKVDSWREYLLGPFPGPGAILVTGLRVMPNTAYGLARTAVMHLRPGGGRALSAFLWGSVKHDAAGRPLLIARGFYPGSLFYAATATYGLDYTCNTWTAHGLHAAGSAVSPAGVVFAAQAMGRARRAALCPLETAGAAAH